MGRPRERRPRVPRVGAVPAPAARRGGDRRPPPQVLRAERPASRAGALGAEPGAVQPGHGAPPAARRDRGRGRAARRRTGRQHGLRGARALAQRR